MSHSLILRLLAVYDLVKRYGETFLHVWRERKSLDSPPRLAHEAQFLPAALELQETSVSPAPRVAMALLVAFSLFSLLWAVFGEIDVVATARGRIVPNDRTKVIQPLEAATVKAIRVEEGQAVRAGQILVELDATATSADSARLRSEHAAAQLQAERAKALLAAVASGKAQRISSIPGVASERLAQEQRLLDGEYNEYLAKLARIDAEIARRQAELRSTEEIVRKLENTVPIARQRAQDYKDLVEKNFISKHGFLDKEQARIEQEGDLATQRSRVKELSAALEDGRSQRTALTAEIRRLALDSQSQAELKAAAMAQELIKAQTRDRLMTLTAPVDGTVQQLAIHTVGGVVTPAQQLMVVVPRDNPMEVEAFIENKDIGFVNAGQEAEVKVETFPFTKYGTIHAQVLTVSHDAVNDEKRGLIFPARVHLERAAIPVENKQVNLQPGMAVTVEIKTGTRRVIEYFLSPLMQYKDESLRER
ncbi:MAG: HlyD family type I secretion periplasmic adaptor subunit [Actinomycetota bacterium]